MFGGIQPRGLNIVRGMVVVAASETTWRFEIRLRSVCWCGWVRLKRHGLALLSRHGPACLKCHVPARLKRHGPAHLKRHDPACLKRHGSAHLKRHDPAR